MRRSRPIAGMHTRWMLMLAGRCSSLLFFRCAPALTCCDPGGLAMVVFAVHHLFETAPLSSGSGGARATRHELFGLEGMPRGTVYAVYGLRREERKNKQEQERRTKMSECI